MGEINDKVHPSSAKDRVGAELGKIFLSSWLRQSYRMTLEETQMNHLLLYSSVHLSYSRNFHSVLSHGLESGCLADYIGVLGWDRGQHI